MSHDTTVNQQPAQLLKAVRTIEDRAEKNKLGFGCVLRNVLKGIAIV